MSWKLTHCEPRVFPRNPLVAVVVDFRYHPILKIAAKVPDFQEAVRSVFADYHEQAQQFVTVQPVLFGGVHVSHDKVFIFRKSDGTASLSLSTSSILLDSRKHESREQLIDEVLLGTTALLKLYPHVDSIRLGLRYVNVVDRQAISEDLGRSVEWDELITKEFLSVPSGLADFADTLYNVEVSSAMQEGGLTVRYGLLRDPKDNRKKFRFDSDRYIEAPFDAELTPQYLATFAQDVYCAFMAANGPALREWMEASA